MPDHRQIRYARVIGLLCTIGGFAAIGLGWSGAARKDCVECQLPFLLSGGAVGVGLIVFGSGLLVMAQLRSDSRRVGVRLEEVAAALVKAAERDVARAGAGEVVAGTSTYHRPDCRLIRGKTGLDLVPLAKVKERGLSPCRVCSPPEPPGELERAEPTHAPKPGEAETAMAKPPAGQDAEPRREEAPPGEEAATAAPEEAMVRTGKQPSERTGP
jgi:hypothetical protein